MKHLAVILTPEQESLQKEVNKMLKPKRLQFMSRLSLAALVIVTSMTLLLSGCQPNPLESPKQGSHPNGEQKPDISAKPAATKTKVTLYFGGKAALYLVPEEREITKGTETLESAIIAELIKGPQNADLFRTIPEGTKLLSVSVLDGTAYVNFSKELKTKHWGGSAGETMTIYSVVNSLAVLPGIQKVQFLLEGDKQESIFGNNDTSIPFTPEWYLTERPQDYYPLTAGSYWEYEGSGNEYASFTRKVLYTKGNLAETSEDNGGTVATRVIDTTDDVIKVVYFMGEDYEPKNLLESNFKRNSSSIILQGPMTVGTSWTDQGVNKSIVAVDAVVDTPAGKFENCIKVKSAGQYDTIYQYYKKDVGMVKQEFISGDTHVTSTLKKYQVK
jgi:spore germination protein GerM